MEAYCTFCEYLKKKSIRVNFSLWSVKLHCDLICMYVTDRVSWKWGQNLILKENVSYAYFPWKIVIIHCKLFPKSVIKSLLIIFPVSSPKNQSITSEYFPTLFYFNLKIRLLFTCHWCNQTYCVCINTTFLYERNIICLS